MRNLPLYVVFIPALFGRWRECRHLSNPPPPPPPHPPPPPPPLSLPPPPPPLGLLFCISYNSIFSSHETIFSSHNYLQMVFSDNTHGFFHDGGVFPNFAGNFYCALSRNQLRCVAQSITHCCAILCFSAVLTKQFSYIKSEFFSTSTFTSVSNLEACGCFAK